MISCLKLLLLLLLFPIVFLSQEQELFINKDSLLDVNQQLIFKYQKGARNKNNLISLSEAYITRGSIYCNELNQYDSALLYFNKGLINDLKILDSKLYTKGITGVAKVYGVTQRLDQAIEKHNEALSIQEKSGDTLGTIVSLYQLGICEYDIDRQMAMNYFKEANRLSKKVDYNQYIALTYRAIGQFYLDVQLNDSASIYLEKAIPILIKEELFYDLCNLNLQFALLYSRSGNYELALSYAMKAKEIAYEYSYLHLMKNVHDVLTEVYYYKGECDNAIENLEMKHYIVDSLSGFKIQRNIERISIQYKVKLKEEINKQLKAENKAIKLEKANDRFMFIVSLLVITIVVIIIFGMYLLKKRKLTISVMEVELAESKKVELSNRLDVAQKMILEKNTLIDKLKLTMADDILGEEKSKRLLEKLNTKNEWSEFMIEFEMLYPNFIAKLNNIVCDSLTKNDIRLSVLMKLNLSNKEISDLLYVTDAAVKKGKNRLSKKIVLQKGEKLTGYINKL